MTMNDKIKEMIDSIREDLTMVERCTKDTVITDGIVLIELEAIQNGLIELVSHMLDTYPPDYLKVR